MPSPAPSADAEPIGKPALRLLTALAGGGAGVVDPSAPGFVAVRSDRRGVSLSAGRFPTALAEELAARDLAGWSAPAGGTARLGVTEAGRAFLLRREAGPGDDRFRQQHGAWRTETLAGEGGGAPRVSVNGGESPLDWLSRRKGRDGEALIDRTEREAGERLRADLTKGGILPGVTARWSAGPSGGPSDPAAATDATIAARQRVRHALKAVGGDFAGLLVDLCGFLKGLEEIKRERRWPARSAKVVVRLALRRLAEHYGLSSEATGRDVSGRLRAWQAEWAPAEADQPGREAAR